MEEKEKHIWRMHQPSEAPRKYSIFPSKDKLSIGSDRQSPESSLSLALGEKHNVQKPKELNKRRKPSVTELGPMTTVHEVSMDSREYLEHLLSMLEINVEQLLFQDDLLYTKDLSVHQVENGDSVHMANL